MKRWLRFRSRCGGPTELRRCGDALRSLSGLLRVGLPLRAALGAWHEHAPPEMVGQLRQVANRVRAGAPTVLALEPIREVFGPDMDSLQAVAGIMTTAGGNGAAMIERLAEAIDARAARLAAARAAGSGAKLSGRLVAALPLAFLPLAPLSRAPLLDPVGLLLLFAGGGLAVTGTMWISRLMPVPPAVDDPAAALADIAAAVLAGGVDVGTALEAISAHPVPGVRMQLDRARRLVQLGLGWSEALLRSDDHSLVELGLTLQRTDILGLPTATVLSSWARARRVEVERGFEVATRRAGVLMMIPLALCVLPSFILLGVAPFLRGLSLR